MIAREWLTGYDSAARRVVPGPSSYPCSTSRRPGGTNGYVHRVVNANKREGLNRNAAQETKRTDAADSDDFVLKCGFFRSILLLLEISVQNYVTVVSIGMGGGHGSARQTGRGITAT